jgi:hypothetical protein
MRGKLETDHPNSALSPRVLLVAPTNIRSRTYPAGYPRSVRMTYLYSSRTGSPFANNYAWYCRPLTIGISEPESSAEGKAAPHQPPHNRTSLPAPPPREQTRGRASLQAFSAVVMEPDVSTDILRMAGCLLNTPECLGRNVDCLSP